MVVGLLAGDVVVVLGLPGLPPPNEVQVEKDRGDEYGGTMLDDGMDRVVLVLEVVVVVVVVVVGNGGDAVVVSPAEREDKAEDKG